MGQSCPSPLCLRITHIWTLQGRGKADPRPYSGLRFHGLGSLSGPYSGPSSPSSSSFSTIVYSEFFDCDTVPVIVNHNEQVLPCLLTSQSQMKNCDVKRYEKSLAVISVVIKYRKSLNKYPCSKYSLWRFE